MPFKRPISSCRIKAAFASMMLTGTMLMFFSLWFNGCAHIPDPGPQPAPIPSPIPLPVPIPQPPIPLPPLPPLPFPLPPMPGPGPGPGNNPAPWPGPYFPLPLPCNGNIFNCLHGVSLAGADFGQQNLPGTFGRDYTYPTHAEIDYFVSKGMNVMRIPFMWERLQHNGNQELDATEIARLDDIVSYATGKGAFVLTDPHNYARYYGKLIGTEVSYDTFADFWRRMAQRYQGNNKVIFGLMNEPHDIPTEQWANAAQVAINAIRQAGAKNMIFVPGVAWTGAHSWNDTYYGTPNAKVMLSIQDPLNNYAFEVHEYLDQDFSGTSPNCVSGTYGSDNMKNFTAWLKANGKKGFLGEFGGGNNQLCADAIEDLLHHIEANSDVYLGWAWWAAGPWWGNYMFSIEPGYTQNMALMNLLQEHLPSQGQGQGGGGNQPNVRPPLPFPMPPWGAGKPSSHVKAAKKGKLKHKAAAPAAPGAVHAP